MGMTYGTAKLAGRRYGTTDILKVYAGDQLVWPPQQTVRYMSSLVTGNVTPSLPAHQVGDLLVVVAQCSQSGATPVPSLPTGGWIEAYRSPANVGVPLLIGYKFATSTTTAAGTWTNAAYTAAYVFRGADTTTPFGAIATAVGNNTTPAVTPVATDGSSVLVHMFYNNGTTGIWGAAPVGMETKNAVARMANLRRIDSTVGNGVTLSHTVSPVPNWRTLQFEILPPGLASEPQELYGVDEVKKPGRVVDFTAKKGFPPDPDNEAFMFRCSTVSGLDGYVGRTFTKTFPSNTAYSGFDCTLEDLYGDGTAAGLTKATISFRVTPTA